MAGSEKWEILEALGAETTFYYKNHNTFWFFKYIYI